MKNEFNLIQFQDALIAKFEDIECNGIGGHKQRSRGRIRRSARNKLEAMGYSWRQSMEIVDQAYDVFRLQQVATAE